jgi:N-acetylmuramoyl-L-alanine amidase
MLLEVILASQIQKACLAENIYHEARAESLDGQLMVAEVTINRVLHPAFPDTVCGVVNQPSQFSWVGKGYTIAEEELWAEIQSLVEELADGTTELLGTEALYFHSAGPRPAWTAGLELLGKVENHVFYTEKTK